MLRAFVYFLPCLLLACGGGTVNQPFGPITTLAGSPGAAEGIWSGSTSGNAQWSMAILGNGETWSMITSGSIPVEAMVGMARANNDKIVVEAYSYSIQAGQQFTAPDNLKVLDGIASAAETCGSGGKLQYRGWC